MSSRRPSLPLGFNLPISSTPPVISNRPEAIFEGKKPGAMLLQRMWRGPSSTERFRVRWITAAWWGGGKEGYLFGLKLSEWREREWENPPEGGRGTFWGGVTESSIFSQHANPKPGDRCSDDDSGGIIRSGSFLKKRCESSRKAIVSRLLYKRCLHPTPAPPHILTIWWSWKHSWHSSPSPWQTPYPDEYQTPPPTSPPHSQTIYLHALLSRSHPSQALPPLQSWRYPLAPKSRTILAGAKEENSEQKRQRRRRTLCEMW